METSYAAGDARHGTQGSVLVNRAAKELPKDQEQLRIFEKELTPMITSRDTEPAWWQKGRIASRRIATNFRIATDLIVFFFSRGTELIAQTVATYCSTAKMRDDCCGYQDRISEWKFGRGAVHEETETFFEKEKEQVVYRPREEI